MTERVRSGYRLTACKVFAEIDGGAAFDHVFTLQDRQADKRSRVRGVTGDHHAVGEPFPAENSHQRLRILAAAGSNYGNFLRRGEKEIQGAQPFTEAKRMLAD